MSISIQIEIVSTIYVQDVTYLLVIKTVLTVYMRDSHSEYNRNLPLDLSERQEKGSDL